MPTMGISLPEGLEKSVQVTYVRHPEAQGKAGSIRGPHSDK
ncbi:hypothetical protein SAMN05216417_10638 [Nitrosospira multiformis]|uniref:Uncharacterized protein n=1 Tax=Nitrosospira multiformis TaxID=1231 RepID=A0A1I7GWZ5_9PROT|nr:hypothetical protein SAMN05216417_10638 [Nitrosospira multiformis]